MSIKLRDLIRKVRNCKTAAEEDAVIAKECAACRTAFASKEGKYRHRNVAKLLFLHMLGYPTHFGQMECLKLIVSNKFAEKRIGYLGLMLLLDERQKVLMLVPNSLQNDFSNNNPYVVGLALASMGNISSADMSRDLAGDVAKLFRHPNAYLRKKAACCAIRIVRKVPDMIEDFLPAAIGMLTDKNHAVLITSLSLIIEMMKLDSSTIDSFRKLVPNVVRLLKNLLLAGYVSEYDVAGMTDPFLQAKIIHFLRLVGTGDAVSSEAMNDCLAQVTLCTEPTKNPGNAILYEAVMTIMSIESESGLRVLAVNILGRFLMNRDNNIRYVALNTLCKMLQSGKETQSIQRHRNIIVECLKDPDISIRRRALDLIYALVTKNNVQALVHELLNYLSLSTGDEDFKCDLTDKIINVIVAFAPNKKWHISTIINVLQTAGHLSRESVSTDFIIFLSQCNKEEQAYAVHELIKAFDKTSSSSKNKNKNYGWASFAIKNAQSVSMNAGIIRGTISSEGNTTVTSNSDFAFAIVVAYVIGEYGEYLVTSDGVNYAQMIANEKDDNEVKSMNQQEEDSEDDDDDNHEIFELYNELDIIKRLEIMIKHPISSSLLRSYLLNSLIKLGDRFSSSSQNKIKSLVSLYQDNISLELQQRSIEYAQLLNLGISGNIVQKMPAMHKRKKKKAHHRNNTNDDNDDSDEEDSEEESSEEESSEEEDMEMKESNGVVNTGGQENNLFDLDLFSTTTDASTPSPVVPIASATSAEFDIFSMFADQPPTNNDQITTPQVTNNNTDLTNMIFLNDVQTPTTTITNHPSYIAHEFSMVQVNFDCNVDSKEPSIMNILATFKNKSASEMTNFEFQVSVPKYLTIKLQPASSTTVTPFGQVTQMITVTNSMINQKKIVMRVRMKCTHEGQNKVEDAQLSTFPN